VQADSKDNVDAASVPEYDTGETMVRKRAEMACKTADVSFAVTQVMREAGSSEVACVCVFEFDVRGGRLFQKRKAKPCRGMRQAALLQWLMDRTRRIPPNWRRRLYASMW